MTILVNIQFSSASRHFGLLELTSRRVCFRKSALRSCWIVLLVTELDTRIPESFFSCVDAKYNPKDYRENSNEIVQNALSCKIGVG